MSLEPVKIFFGMLLIRVGKNFLILRQNQDNAALSPAGYDSQQGDNWDHVAYDPEHRLVVSPQPQCPEGSKKLLFFQRLGYT
jgi:hypothetical protein